MLKIAEYSSKLAITSGTSKGTPEDTPVMIIRRPVTNAIFVEINERSTCYEIAKIHDESSCCES